MVLLPYLAVFPLVNPVAIADALFTTLLGLTTIAIFFVKLLYYVCLATISFYV